MIGILGCDIEAIDTREQDGDSEQYAEGFIGNNTVFWR
tara:strand:- start:412 stop:525 length:114 start_codon:yes stop_codon:yes gene_type:complete